MAQYKGKFDFQSQGPDELGFSAGEILTVLDTSTPGGWWKAQNSAGQQGYIPSDFVDVLESDSENIPEPCFAPPPLPADEPAPATSSYDRGYSSSTTSAQNSGWYPASSNSTSYNTQAQDSWSPYPAESRRADSSCNAAAPQTSGWDSDEFDDEDEVSEAPSSASSTVTRSVSQGAVSTPARVISPKPGADGPPSRPVPTKSVAPSGGVFMRLSDYAKTGVGAFILGQTKGPNAPDSERVEIIISEGLVQWRVRGSELTYRISPEHKVGGKLAGLKKFVEYTIAKIDGSNPVQRRYKQFDWLHEQMRNKFAVIAIPPLPHKQITGRYEEDFIEVRKRGLQAWLSRISKHPVVSYSKVFQHFVSCTDTKNVWKQGKRAAEKDEWQGGRWLLAVKIPEVSDEFNDRDEVRKFEEYSEALHSAVRSMIDTQHLYSKKQSCVYKRDYQKISSSFTELANAFQKSSMLGLTSLSRSTEQTATVFDEIAHLFGNQPDCDAVPFLDALYEYKGMLSDGLPEILGMGRSAAASLADIEKQGHEQKMSQEDVDACRQRQRVLNLILLAERTHLCKQQAADFEQMFCQFIRAQIAFYTNVTRKLEEALRVFPSSTR